MGNTLFFNANPKYSLTETILFAITKLLWTSNLDRILVSIDNKDYDINRGDKITDIMENWCRIKFDIEDEINLSFKDDNCKFHFYATLLNKDYFAMALYTINFAINVDKYIKENGTISSFEFYEMEKRYIRLYPSSPTTYSVLPSFMAINETEELLKNCMIYSNKIEKYHNPCRFGL